MNFQDLFNEYYSLFRGDNAVPDSTDPEWTIAVRYGNSALRRLENVDNEDWEWLWTDTATEGQTLTWPTVTTTTSAPTVQTFDGPTNMRKPGGWLKFTDPNGGYFLIDVIPAYLVQTKANGASYAWWTGGVQQGWTLNIALSSNQYSGYSIDFPYYKQITYFNATSPDGANQSVSEDGNTVTECPDPNYIINSILAARLRATRNYPSYQTAKQDAEISLKNMQQKNRSGIDGHSWNLNDTSSGAFGVGTSGFGI